MVDGRLRPGMALALDMDGVVVDSNALHTQAWMLYNRRFGIDAGDSLAERMYGRRNDEIVRDFFGPGLSPEEIDAHGAAKEQLYREMLEPRFAEALVPGVREFLARHAAEPVALATNAEPANVNFVLDRGGLRGFFRVVVDGHQVRHPKPHPEIYLRAAQLLAAAPRNCIVFEDSFSGVPLPRKPLVRASSASEPPIVNCRAPVLQSTISWTRGSNSGWRPRSRAGPDGAP